MDKFSKNLVSTNSVKEIIRTLIGFDTTSNNSNLELINFAQNILLSHGAECEIIFNKLKNKANLFASVGPKVPGGVILSGHTDVVPVINQKWDSDPFNLTEKNGRLYGRGACDMKSFIGIALALLPEFSSANLKFPIHFSLSYDEEVGCLGVSSLIKYIKEKKITNASIIVGEPTGMEVVTAHKGLCALKTSITGKEAHSSSPELGTNAIFVANKLIGFLRSLENDLKKELEINSKFDPPYPTLNVGTINGGTAINIVANSCTFEWEYRYLPGTDPLQILNKFNTFVIDEYIPKLISNGQKTEITTQQIAEIPALEESKESKISTLALKLAKKNKVYHVSYGSEAGFFRKSGLDTVLCGPGNISEAHRPNEFITNEQINECIFFMRNLYSQLSI